MTRDGFSRCLLPLYYGPSRGQGARAWLSELGLSGTGVPGRTIACGESDEEGKGVRRMGSSRSSGHVIQRKRARDPGDLRVGAAVSSYCKLSSVKKYQTDKEEKKIKTMFQRPVLQVLRQFARHYSEGSTNLVLERCFVPEPMIP
ncbi:single-stranded DNA-binding protein, mitochondrial isoform X2 [Antechinus flavipes]|uniref:single-stranded DNA-binding protein, mitochondrial isoform X2 n=1 Tax=Antechinus flavipes TaxID=38775 RepID=UPI002235A72A|nr:single-stranded DNA-binding protein, mitochondrial isoform X2 [Antechinus flavipes]